jgi:hypothetical protein
MDRRAGRAGPPASIPGASYTPRLNLSTEQRALIKTDDIAVGHSGERAKYPVAALRYRAPLAELRGHVAGEAPPERPQRPHGGSFS